MKKCYKMCTHGFDVRTQGWEIYLKKKRFIHKESLISVIDFFYNY